MNLDGWVTFWTWVCVISCTLGALMFLIILPFGVRDLVLLYRFLNAQTPPDNPPRDPESDG